MPLDAKDLLGEQAGERRCITGARAHLQHTIGMLDLGKLEHARNDVGLRDRLVGPNRKRTIFEREVAQSVGNESGPRHAAKGMKHAFVRDAASAKLLLNPSLDVSMHCRRGLLIEATARGRQ